MPPELLRIDAMLRSFPRADEDHWNIPRVALLQDGIGIYIDFSEGGTKFSQERRDGRLGFVAEVASRTRVESDVAGAGNGQAGVFRMKAHRFRSKVHLTGEQATMGRTGCIITRRSLRSS